jgi:hypothetical protein
MLVEQTYLDFFSNFETFLAELLFEQFFSKAIAQGLAKKLGKMFLPVTAICDFF